MRCVLVERGQHHVRVYDDVLSDIFLLLKIAKLGRAIVGIALRIIIL